MTSERHETLPKFLSSLSQIALEHTQATGTPANFEFTVTAGEAGTVAFFETDGTPVHHADTEPPIAPGTEVDFVLTEAKATKAFTEDGTYAVQSSTDGTVTATFTPAPTTGDEPAADSGDLTAVATAPNNGLALLGALKKHGNTGGYAAADIDAAAQKLDVTFSPEIRFYRSNVKDGKVADGPNGDVVASALDAEFGASAGNGPLPTPRPSDVVQPLRSHKLWIEIAHDKAGRYAADLAPGAAGSIGQIIGRPNESVNPPQLVARSLADFVSGDWVDEETAAASWTPSTIVIADPTTWQFTADDFEGLPRFIQLQEEEPVAEEEPTVEEPVVEEVAQEAVEDSAEAIAEEAPVEEDAAVAAPVAAAAPVASPVAAPVAKTAAEIEELEDFDDEDEPYDPLTSLMTGSDISFGDVIAADDLAAVVPAAVEAAEPQAEPAEEVLVAQTNVDPAPLVPAEKVEEPTQMPMHPVADPAPAPTPASKPVAAQPADSKPAATQAAEPQPAVSEADAKHKVPRKAKKRAQRVSFEVSSSDFSAEPSAMTDDFMVLAPVIDSNDIKGLDEAEIAKQSSPISPEADDSENLTGSIFAVNKIQRPASQKPKKPSERSSQDIAQDFAAVAFNNPYDEDDDDDDDYFDDRNEGGIRKAFRRFFG